MNFSEMDTKHKVIVFGGGALAVYFLFRAMSGRGISSSSPAPVVDQGKIEQDLASEVAGAVGSTSDQFKQMLAGYQDQQSQMISGMYDHFDAAIQKTNDNLQNTTQKLLDQMAKPMLQPPVQSSWGSVSPSYSSPAAQAPTMQTSAPANVDSVIAQIHANATAWNTASDSQRQALHDANVQLGNSIGAKYDASGTWTLGGRVIN